MDHFAMQSQGAQSIAAAPDVATEMQKLVNSTDNIAGRLGDVHLSLCGLIGRLYGEGGIDARAADNSPKAVGVFHSLAASLNEIQVMAEKLEVVTKRLSRHA